VSQPPLGEELGKDTATRSAAEGRALRTCAGCWSWVTIAVSAAGGADLHGTPAHFQGIITRYRFCPISPSWAAQGPQLLTHPRATQPSPARPGCHAANPGTAVPKVPMPSCLAWAHRAPCSPQLGAGCRRQGGVTLHKPDGFWDSGGHMDKRVSRRRMTSATTT